MSRTLKQNDIRQILYGATFLGAGGGGSLSFGIDMLQKLIDEGADAQLELFTLDEIESRSLYGTMVAGLGSPKKMLESSFGPDAVMAFKAFQKAFKAEGKDVKFLYSGELGGFNTFVPMMVAICSDSDPKKRIPFLDVDGNGRAVPELNTSLNSARQFPPYPIGLGTSSDDMIIAYPSSDATAETIARQLCLGYDMRIGFSTWGMNIDELRDNAVVGAMTRCQDIGKALVAAKEAKSSPFEAIRAHCPDIEIHRVMRGTITKIETRTVNGFDVGVTTLEDKATGKSYTIDFQNENLLIRDASGKTYITVPELICTVTTESNPVGEICYPLTNADTELGMEIEVMVTPASPYWWDAPHHAYKCWIDSLKRVDYSGEAIRFPGAF